MKKLTIWRFIYMAADDRNDEPYPDSFIGTIYEFSNWLSNMAEYYGYWWVTKPKKRHATEDEIKRTYGVEILE